MPTPLPLVSQKQPQSSLHYTQQCANSACYNQVVVDNNPLPQDLIDILAGNITSAAFS